MKKIITYLVTCSFLFLITPNAYSYDNEYVHQNININAVQHSEYFYNTMKSLGFEAMTAQKLVELYVANKKIKTWFEDGAKLEDETHCRSKFHFHDPTKSWDTAGLSNIAIDTYCLDYAHRSSLVWAQDSGNLWTWQKARQYYFDALTNPGRNIREQNLAYTFRSLGQVMHLISDSSVPAHVRNDIHVFPYTLPVVGISIGDPTFESWAMSNYKNLTYTGIIIDQSIFNNAIPYPPAPFAISALWDLDKYNGSNPAITIEPMTGLAEYSNANFFSEDTIFSDYAYPAWTSVEEYEEIIDATTGKKRTYLRKIRDGERIEHLAAGKRFYKYLPSPLKSSGLILDEKCYEDYAEKLLPRAVGYSAGLLDYFFRGKINIIQISKDTFQIVNASDEDIEGNLNSFKLYYDDIADNRYEIPLAFLDSSGNQYTDQNTVLLIPKQTTGSFTVKLLSTPTAPNTGQYMLVFKGRIGNEGIAPYDMQYAVAAQLITPHFLTYVNVSGQWDIYEYDQSGNRLYNVTGALPRGESYYNGIPNPVNPDLVLFHTDSGCYIGTMCLHMLTRSTGEVINFEKYGTYWWSKDGTRIYKHGEYYDFQTGAWNTFDAGWCSVFANFFGTFSPDESKVAFQGGYYDDIKQYDYQDILIMTNWQPSHVVDMNSRRVVSVNKDTCSDYVRDEGFNDTKPDFHPSLERILFASNADGVFDATYGDRVPYNIYLADMVTGEVQRLTDAPAGSMGYRQAVWSFDGRQILMIGGYPPEIYLMPSGGGIPQKITDEGLKHYYPKWIRLMP